MNPSLDLKYRGSRRLCRWLDKRAPSRVGKADWGFFCSGLGEERVALAFLLAYSPFRKQLVRVPASMKAPQMNLKRRRGFTLVELLVVIAIIAVLATLSTLVAQFALAKAAAARGLERIHQSGLVLLSNAQENNGKMQYSKEDYEDIAGQPPLMPYNIIRNGEGLRYIGAQIDTDICTHMHWDSKKLPPLNYQDNCFGINYTLVPDKVNPSIYVANWTDGTVSVPGGTQVSVKTLILTTVTRPDAYPILLDSSDSSGNECFQIGGDSSAGGFVGLRNSGKANAYFLDGSSRMLDKADLLKAGFDSALDNSVKPPKSVNLN